MEEKKFREIIKILQDQRHIIPASVSVTKNINEETPEQIELVQEKFLGLPENIKDKLASNETGEKIKRIGEEFNLTLIQMSDIARAIRSFYFGELKIEDFPFHLAKEIPIELTQAKEITNIVLREIINDDSEEQALKKELLSIPLAQALKEIPEIGEQVLTSDRINILSFPDPVRPSLKNWIADYASALGHGEHSAIVRGNYLFHSANTKKLNDVDRQKLAQLLKSFDEKTPLTINKATKQIILSPIRVTSPRPAAPTTSEPDFAPVPTRNQIPNKFNPVFQPVISQRQTISQPPIERDQKVSSSKIRFSSPQKLSYEKLEPYRITPFSDRNSVPQKTNTPPAKNTRALGKNVVNLRDN